MHSCNWFCHNYDALFSLQVLRICNITSAWMQVLFNWLLDLSVSKQMPWLHQCLGVIMFVLNKIISDSCCNCCQQASAKYFTSFQDYQEGINHFTYVIVSRFRCFYLQNDKNINKQQCEFLKKKHCTL